MRYLSLFSGIEAATVAWHPLGWTPWAFSEIDPFPCAVLAHHYPHVPNLGDVSRFKEWPDAVVDVLVGGSPCQAFSVAGLRKGLDDPRGNLTLTYLAVVARYRPRWVVWENVPGVLSIDGGRVFGTFLGALGQLGYGWAYRVLDAQYFGVAQRRRRVFVVAHAGGLWQRAAAVLFERASLRGDHAPRREAGKAAPTIPSRSTAGGGLGTDHDLDGGLITMAHGQGGAEISFDRGPTLPCNHEAPIVAHALRGEGFDASEDGTGRGTPLVPVAFDTTQITSLANRSNPQPGDPCHPLAAGAHPPAIGFNWQNGGGYGKANDGLGITEEGVSSLSQSQTPAVAFSAKDHGADAGELAPTLRAMGHGASHANGGGQVAIAAAMQVRRLTPRECERLQGFPDDYTLIPWRKKPASECPDGPRYKALGNSMAVPCMAWIGRRIAQVEQLAPLVG